MKENLPLVSICIPTYNGERYLQEALDSVKAQTYKNIEVIISDDNSKDHTLEICDRFKNEVDFPVYIYNHTPSGIGANWNHCVEKANGEYIKFLFQDDRMNEQCIEHFIRVVIKTNEKVFFCKRNIINEQGNLTQNVKFYKKIKDLQLSINLNIDDFYKFSKKDLNRLGCLYPDELEFNFLGEPVASFIHKEVFKTTGKFSLKLKQLLDTEYWLRILKNYPIVIINEKLIDFRIHTEQTTAKNSKKGVSEGEYLQKFIIRNFFFYLNKKVRSWYIYKKYVWLYQLKSFLKK